MRVIGSHSLNIAKTFLKLFASPHFIALTVIGNVLVFFFAWQFFLVEHGSNPLVDEWMDAVWWAFTTVTTVGFGDIVPATFQGRIIGILLMLMGTAIFAVYVALIADAFLTMELKRGKSIRRQPKRQSQSLAKKTES